MWQNSNRNASKDTFHRSHQSSSHYSFTIVAFCWHRCVAKAAANYSQNARNSFPLAIRSQHVYAKIRWMEAKYHVRFHLMVSFVYKHILFQTLLLLPTHKANKFSFSNSILMIYLCEKHFPYAKIEYWKYLDDVSITSTDRIHKLNLHAMLHNIYVGRSNTEHT